MKNMNDVLAETNIDKEVGVKVTPMAGDENLSLLVAEVAARKVLKPHYHKNSVEIYFIEQGEGIMKLGDLKEDGDVKWTNILDVKKGDCITVKPGQVHTLENQGPENVIIIVGCPMSNITTDRYVVKS
ncbi:MAG TPA: cupin domain-containing protein [Desulfomonilia bacterium]